MILIFKYIKYFNNANLHQQAKSPEELKLS